MLYTLKAHEGRIYFGYGNWEAHPVTVITSYDPGSNAFILEHFGPTDAIDQLRSIGGKLYVPSIDPVHYDGFRDYSVREAGRWRSFTPGGFFHAFDMNTLDGVDLWMVGSKSANETPWSGKAVMRSFDEGRHWIDVSPQNSLPDERCYYGFAVGGRFYSGGYVYTGNVPARGPNFGTFTRATLVRGGSNEFVLGLTGRVPGLGVGGNSLESFDGTNGGTLASGVVNFTVVSCTLYTLMGNKLWRSTSLTSTEVVWEELPLAPAPGATSIEVVGELLFMGDGSGQLWAGRLDGAPFARSAATVRNELPDRFGRALSMNGATLAVGAPEFSGAQFLSGQVTTWERTESGWSQTQAIDPPEPAFAGAFGTDVSVAGDVLAVLESGRDSTGRNRGSSAQVHVYQWTGTNWEIQQTLTHPYAHSVALDARRLAIGTSSAVLVYRLLETNLVQLTLEATLSHNAPGYLPTGRVALEGDCLVYGLAGDASRSGGPGQVNVYERNSEGVWQLISALRRDSPPLPSGLAQHPDAFASALALKNGWLAIGAPRDDAAAAQAGAVHLYERVFGTNGMTYVHRQTLASPIAQSEARFGSSVSLTDSHLIIGAPGLDTSERQDGQVFIYQKNETNWVKIGEVFAPAATQGEFGTEVLATTNLILASCDSSLPSAPLDERIRILSMPNLAEAADLQVTHIASPAIVTNGSLVVHSITLTNDGPATARQVALRFDGASHLEIQSHLANGMGCTVTGSDVICVANQLPPGAGATLEIHARVDLPNSCGVLLSEVLAFASESDFNSSNNRVAVRSSSQPPSITLSAPADGTMLLFHGKAKIVANVWSPMGIAHVMILTNNSPLRRLTSPPYEFTWTDIPAGNYQITAVATDGCGVSSASAVKTITVASNRPPDLRLLSPVAGTRLGSNAITIIVSATDVDGAVTRVQPYLNSAPLAPMTNAPYYLVRPNLSAGTWVFRAIAYDDAGASTTSHLARVQIGPDQIGPTNWIAINDHSPGPATVFNVSRWDIQGSSPGPAGRLRNANVLALVPAWLTITRSGILSSEPEGVAPAPGSPASVIFGGYVDFVTGPAANVIVTGSEWVRYHFEGLDPNLRYNFRGTAIRGSPDYTNRWTLVEIDGARSFNPDHTPGCLTHIPGHLESNQVAINTGFNVAGEVVGWTNIQPNIDGTFAIVCAQYPGPRPDGTSGGDSGYALTAVRLEEIAVPVEPPPLITGQPVSLTLSPGSPAMFSVTTTGQGPLTYQWLRNWMPLPIANGSSIEIGASSTNDVGSYAVAIFGATGGTVSRPAVLTLLDLDMQSDLAGDFARLNVFGPPNQRYRVDHLDMFDSVSVWNFATNLTVLSNQVSFVEPTSPTRSNRFYRVIPIPQ